MEAFLGKQNVKLKGKMDPKEEGFSVLGIKPRGCTCSTTDLCQNLFCKGPEHLIILLFLGHDGCNNWTFVLLSMA
jgi:hypothetical protein